MKYVGKLSCSLVVNLGRKMLHRETGLVYGVLVSCKTGFLGRQPYILATFQNLNNVRVGMDGWVTERTMFGFQNPFVMKIGFS